MAIVALKNSWAGRKPPVGYGVDRSHPLARGLGGAWLLNEGGGGAVNLAAGGSAGAVVGTPSRVTTTQGPAVSTDGSSSYLDCGTPAGLNGATQATLACLVYKASNAITAGFGGSAGSTSGSGSRFSWIWYTDGVLYCSAENGSATFGSTSSVAAGWRLVVLCYDGTASGTSGRLRIYVDGADVGSGFSGVIPATLGTVGPVTFGRDSSDRLCAGTYAFGYCWPGRALSVAEVASLSRDPYQFLLAPAARLSFAAVSAPPPTASAPTLMLLGCG